MSGFLYGIGLQWKIDFRRKDILIMYYVMPLVFFLVIGGIFSSVMPDIKQTLIYCMTIFAVSAGGFVGAPSSIIGFYSSDMKKAYVVGGIPLWTQVLNSFLSAIIHMSIVSVIITVLSPLLFHAAAVSNVLRYIGMLFLLMITTTAVGMLLGLFVKSQSKLTMFSILLFLPSIMLSGIMFPSNMLTGIFQVISNAIPARWAYTAMLGQNVLRNTLLLLGVFVVSLIFIGIRLKRIAKE